MKRLHWTAALLLLLCGLSPAAPVEEAAHPPSLKLAAASIQSELEVHGERVMGRDVYHWSTRLERIEDCRAEFSVRLTNNLSESTTETESVSFSLGALNPYGIEWKQKHWLELPCNMGQTCIFSTSTCTRRSREGIMSDCTTPTQKRVGAFSLQLDGDTGSVQRLEHALREAVAACRQPSSVSF